MRDVIIIGGGLAGLYTALRLPDDLNITLISKSTIKDTNSYLAQGGIAAELDLNKEEIESHIKDTLNAGSWVNDPASLEVLVKDAKENILNLIAFGVDFDRLDTGDLNVTLEGGHSKRRILHAGGDATGKVMMNALNKKLQSAHNIEVIENAVVSNLIVKDNTCYGVYYFEDNQEKHLLASNTIIATGGLGAIYQHTTNPSLATGDGIAIAKRAGAKLADLEFIQFHPTALYLENNLQQNFLVSEAVRGEGAFLRNNEGERFMDKYHELLELAPRDVVSVSINKEMYNTWHDCVYLDATHLDRDFLVKRFPTIFNKCLENGLDLSRNLIPVIPVQHYSIGGVWTDKYGKTSINNLYANGECAATGVHGANRLASNSLLECVVFGNRIAKQINKQAITSINPDIYPTGNINIKYKDIISDVKIWMEKYVGVVRTKRDLQLAQDLIKRHYDNLMNNHNNTIYYFSALNITTVALEVIKAALKRERTLGCHVIVDD